MLSIQRRWQLQLRNGIGSNNVAKNDCQKQQRRAAEGEHLCRQAKQQWDITVDDDSLFIHIVIVISRPPFIQRQIDNGCQSTSIELLLTLKPNRFLGIRHLLFNVKTIDWTVNGRSCYQAAWLHSLYAYFWPQFLREQEVDSSRTSTWHEPVVDFNKMCNKIGSSRHSKIKLRNTVPLIAF